MKEDFMVMPVTSAAVLDSTSDSMDLQLPVLYTSPLTWDLSWFQHAPDGSQVNDDQALATAIRTVGAAHGTLVIDSGRPLQITKTIHIDASLTITSIAGYSSQDAVIVGLQTGDMVDISAANVKVVGLTFKNYADTGKILDLAGGDTSVINCNLSNNPRNSSTMVSITGSDTHLIGDYFSNFNATSYCWSVAGGAQPNSNSSVEGGWAYGPGQGGLLYDGAGGRTVTNFDVIGWNCITTGATQIDDRSSADLTIQGGVYDQSSQTAISIAPEAATKSVSISDIYVSTAQNPKSGTAISIASSGQAVLGDVSIHDNFIAYTSVGISQASSVGSMSLVDNYVSATSSSMAGTTLPGTTLAMANDFQLQAPAPTTIPAYVPLSISSSAAGASQAGRGMAGISLLDQLGSMRASSGVSQASSRQDPSVPGFQVLNQAIIGSLQAAYFSQFKQSANGQTLSDDDAFAKAVSWCEANNLTLVIDHGATIHLTRSEVVTSPLTIISDGSSVIHSTTSSTTLDIETTSGVTLEGLTFVQESSAGSIVFLGGNGSVISGCSFTNEQGNHSSMVVLAGANQLLDNVDFINNDTAAYCWAANYIDSQSHLNINSKIVGGSASGFGNGGLIGNGSSSGRIEGFQVTNWDCSTTGQYQINATDVFSLQITGGSYSGAQLAAINLGGGIDGDLAVSIANVSITNQSSTSYGIRIDAQGRGGVNDLSVTHSNISGAGTGISLGQQVGNVNILQSDIREAITGISASAPSGTITIGSNNISAENALSLGASQSASAGTVLAGNTIAGGVNLASAQSGNLVIIGNNGTSLGKALQPSAPTFQLPSWMMTPAGTVASTSTSLLLSGNSDPGSRVSLVDTVDGDQAFLGSILADANGIWSFRANGLQDGEHRIRADAEDAAGNLSVLSQELTVSVDATSLFDRAYYMAQYGAKVTSSGLDAWQHYLQLGAKAGLNPNAWFDTAFYLKQHPDVAASGMNPLLQYEQGGWRDGRATSLLFSGTAYWAANPDTAGTNPLLEMMQSTAGAATAVAVGMPAIGSADPLVQASLIFAQIGATLLPSTNAGAMATALYKAGGWTSMVNPDAMFDATFYMNTHGAEVLASGLDPLTHYETVGWREGYDPSLMFSTSGYLAAHPGAAGLSVDPLTASFAAGQTAVTTPGTSTTRIDAMLDTALVARQIATLLPSGGADPAAVNKAYQQGAWKVVTQPNALFNSASYLANNPDVAKAGVDPLAHYENFGWKEGRNPDPLFDDKYYLATNPDVAKAGVNPLMHFETFGWKEGRNPDPLFNTKYYLSHNPDVAKAGINPLVDFETTGWQAGRNPDPLFNTSYYLQQNPDVAAAGVNPLAHFETYGWHEGRNPDPLFDTKYYLLSNKDVAAAGVNPLVHFEAYGWKEGRNPDALFDTKYYLSHNPDVAATGIDPLVDFETNGWQAGRNPDALFDVNYYLSHNPDVAAAHIDPLVHYDQFGWKEGRNPSAAFNTNAYLNANPDVRAAGVDPLAQYFQSGLNDGRAIYSVS